MEDDSTKMADEQSEVNMIENFIKDY